MENHRNNPDKEKLKEYYEDFSRIPRRSKYRKVKKGIQNPAAICHTDSLVSIIYIK